VKSISVYPPTLNGSDSELKREEIRAYFHNTFSLFEKMFDVLKDDDVFYRQSEPTRHPMIFYFGHTAVFFINKLILMKMIQERINPEFESIFAIGVDEMDWDDLESNRSRWPKVSEVRNYRNQVRATVDKLIDEVAIDLPITWDSPMWIILMGIEHERIHIETSSVLHRQMPLEYVTNVPELMACSEVAPVVSNEMVSIPAWHVSLAKEKNHPLYGWDNEYGKYEESVPSFEVAKYLVSNAEFMEFVLDGGYENEAYWDEEGRKFLAIRNAKHPPFWVLQEGVYRYRTLTSLIDMPLSWPVDVNALEAMAFCRYKSQKEGREYTLPSEAEFRVLYEYAGLKDFPEFDATKANVNFAHFASSCSVDRFMHNGLGDVTGNVWQWSRTPIRPFEGFDVHEAYDDFTTPTFDEKHAMICGASWASSGNLLMKYSRYAFRRHFYQHAGFRYVVSHAMDANEEDIYESDDLVAQYCEFQYGKEHFGVKNFALACSEIVAKFADKRGKALDLGCATGRASFELAKLFDVVEGVDFSVRFAGVGSKLKSAGYVAWSAISEGDLRVKQKVTLKELGYDAIAHKVHFWQGDACNLKPNFEGYDFVMATNLIDRLYQPLLFLQSIKERLNEDGILMLTSPYTWQESSTAKEFWLGGYRDAEGKEVKTLQRLQEILGDDFELLHTQDVEFVIAESTRKFQHTIAEVSVWKKR
jgi:5-histidylcysteine sulfoxide synthase/putative 4-mercaptohistidine N1-methyltranferase